MALVVNDFCERVMAYTIKCKQLSFLLWPQPAMPAVNAIFRNKAAKWIVEPVCMVLFQEPPGGQWPLRFAKK